jgi:hypothetical protein
MAGEKELKIKISGDASQLGRESKAAVAQLNDIKGAAQGLIAGFTGGLIGGGIGGVVSSVVTMIGDKIRDVRALMEEADKLNVDPGTAQGVRNLTEAGGGLPVSDAIQAARRARSEALAGDPDYALAFERLGIALKSIEDMDPATLFYQIVTAAEKFDPAAKNAGEQFAALSRLMGGRGIAGDITAYARGGLFREQGLFNGDSGGVLAAIIGASPQSRAKYKQDFELPGEFGVGDEKKAARLRADNDQRAAAVRRATLSVEEQILEVTAQRADLERQIAETTDVVKRERLRSDVISLDAEKVRLQQEAGRAGKPVAALQGFIPQADEFAQRGLFIGGQQRVPAILEQQLIEMRLVVRELTETRRDNQEHFG